MSDDSDDRTASLMTPARLAQLKVRPKATASPAAWLDQLASDAGSGHVRRLIDLRQQLQAQGREGGSAPLASAGEALREALKQLDFDDLQPRGWLARATGKGKEAAAGFALQVQRIGRAGDDFRDELRTAERSQQAQRTATERLVLESEVELRAIEKIMDQGARWLQDMRAQLKQREAEGGDEAAREQLGQDNARCELLVARLKLLRAAIGAAQPVLDRCKATLTRRSALLERMQALRDGAWTAWQAQVAPLAQEAAEGVASEAVEPARQARDALRAALKEAAREALALQSHEQSLAEELAALAAPMQAAA